MHIHYDNLIGQSDKSYITAYAQDQGLKYVISTDLNDEPIVIRLENYLAKNFEEDYDPAEIEVCLYDDILLVCPTEAGILYLYEDLDFLFYNKQENEGRL